VNKIAAKAQSATQPLKKPTTNTAAKPAAGPAAKAAAKTTAASTAQKTAAPKAVVQKAPVQKAAASKTAARKTAAKPAAKAASSPAKKLVGKPTPKPVTQPKVSLPAQPAAAPPPKPATQPAQAPGPTAAAKSSGKTVASTKAAAAPMPTPKVAAKVPSPAPSTPTSGLANKTPVTVKPVAPSPTSGPAVPPTPTAPPKARGNKNSAKYLPPPELVIVASQTAFAPTPPVSNRFMDRFAPARPSKLPDPIEVQKSTYKADPKLVNAWKTKLGRDLTEPEVLAMPDTEYMNDKQMEFFRRRLQQQKDDLLSNAGETTEHLREDTSIVPDPADRATIEEEHALELRTRDRERKLLKKIAQSLTRLETGDYGFCDETGEPIGLARLMARPTATLSLEAQQRRELKQKMFGN